MKLPSKGLVLDANILVRGVLGHRVRQILEAYEETANFYSPDVCFADARFYVQDLFTKRGGNPEAALAVLNQIERIVETVDRTLYADQEKSAHARVDIRDPDDWPVAAVALALDRPIWTEDTDFFGGGIATWTTDRVELYLRP